MYVNDAHLCRLLFGSYTGFSAIGRLYLRVVGVLAKIYVIGGQSAGIILSTQLMQTAIGHKYVLGYEISLDFVSRVI
jgi:hypothetical protein